MERNNCKIALLIDSENISAKDMEGVMNEIAKYGTVIISRFYGDITKCSPEWRDAALNYSLKPMHQFNVASGKNAADMAMALDALDIMYNGKVDTFFLVTSDSDFTPLAMHLKENGMYVIGIGSEKKVTSAYMHSCQEFKYFEYLSEDENEEIKEEHEENNSEPDIKNIIKDIIIENGTDNKIMLSRLGDILVHKFSDFDSRKYGAKTLTTLVKTIKGVEVSQEKNISFVELKTECTYEDIAIECRQIIESKTDKQIKLSRLKQELEKKFGAFEYKTLGFTKFIKLVQSIDGLSVSKDAVKIKKVA